AYDADNLLAANGQKLTGAGQKIAILIDTFPSDSDMKKFWKRNLLPVTLSQVEKIKMQTSPLPAREGEETLDAQWTSGIAPGASMFFDRPAYQQGLGIPAGKKRVVPDISLLAAPETGALVVFNGQEVGIGGTSLSAPAWAGFCALINDSRARANKPPLPFINP